MIEAMIFDLGNVLLHFDPALVENNLRAALPETGPPADRDVARSDALIRAFERGRMSAEEFHREFTAAVGIRSVVPYDVFVRCWSDIFTPNNALIRLLPALAGRLRLVLLSNTNALHIRFAEQRFPDVFAPFSARIYSHVCGYVKPEAEIYRLAVDAAGAPPERIVYIDDIPAYTAAARALGLRAHTYRTVHAFSTMLEEHGIKI